MAEPCHFSRLSAKIADYSLLYHSVVTYLFFRSLISITISVCRRRWHYWYVHIFGIFSTVFFSFFSLRFFILCTLLWIQVYYCCYYSINQSISLFVTHTHKLYNTKNKAANTCVVWQVVSKQLMLRSYRLPMYWKEIQCVALIQRKKDRY